MLGFVSLLMDASSEMIHSLLPIFLVSGLGASALAVGVIEGIAEATASISKVFSGVFSDRLRTRKPLVLLGYGLAAASKPLIALAPSVGWVVAARFVDRLGKGIRGAPRDALIADLTPPERTGAAYGLRQSLDTVGAFAGPLIAVVLMLLFNDDFHVVFWAAVIPALLSVGLIMTAVKEPPGHDGRPARVLSWGDVGRFPPTYWAVIGVVMVMTLARFSEGFLLLRAQSVGLDAAWVPLVYVAMNVVYALVSYPVGHWSDRLGRRGLLLSGFAVLIAADLVLASANSIGAVMAGVALWGLHMGMTQGLLSAMVADTAPPELRGTGFGVFNLASGGALLAASVIAGALWSELGPHATFIAGAVFSAASVAALARLKIFPGALKVLPAKRHMREG